MPILYTFNKTLDNHVLSVSQDTVYDLYYLSDKANSLEHTEEVLNGTDNTIPTTKDGTWKLVLKVEGETDVEIEFNVIKYLQNSIIRDAKNIICVLNGDCGTASLTADCLKKAAKNCLTHKSIFVKLLTFQTLYIPKYGVNYSLIFSNFLEEGAATYNCKLQTTINNILLEECINGNVKSVDKLFGLFIVLYWAGMYFIEDTLATGNDDQLAFVKTKFMYDDIVACLCSYCIDIDVLESLFTVDPSLATITSFQFDNPSDDIDNVDELTPVYLEANGEEQTEEEMLAGKNIAFSNIGRVGFVIENTAPDKYAIYDILNNNITTTVFDTVYDAENLKQTYVSKEFYVPSSIYFKFLKL